MRPGHEPDRFRGQAATGDRPVMGRWWVWSRRTVRTAFGDSRRAWAQPHAAMPGVRVGQCEVCVADTIDDAAEQLKVHPADEGGGLREPVERAVAQRQGGVIVRAARLVSGFLQRSEQVVGVGTDRLTGPVGHVWQHFLYGCPAVDRVGYSPGEQPADQVVTPLGHRYRGLALGPPVQLRRATGAGTVAAGRAAVLHSEQAVLGEPIEVKGGDPPAHAKGIRRRVAAERRRRPGDQVEHGSAGGIVEDRQRGDTVGQRTRSHDTIVKHKSLDFRSVRP